MSPKLTPGQMTPALTLPLAGGGIWDLAAQTPALLSMIVVYRGYHCPVCKGYLQKLNALAADFAAQGVSLVAVSMDSAERAASAKAEWALDHLPIAYGMSEATAQAWGLWVSASIKEAEAAIFAEPGLFWVLPDGKLYLIDIANMPFARPDLDLLLSKLGAVKAGYPPRGTRA